MVPIQHQLNFRNKARFFVPFVNESITQTHLLANRRKINIDRFQQTQKENSMKNKHYTSKT